MNEASPRTVFDKNLGTHDSQVCYKRKKAAWTLNLVTYSTRLKTPRQRETKIMDSSLF